MVYGRVVLRGTIIEAGADRQVSAFDPPRLHGKDVGGVAQLDRACGFVTLRCPFESGRPRHPLRSLIPWPFPEVIHRDMPMSVDNCKRPFASRRIGVGVHKRKRLLEMHTLATIYSVNGSLMIYM
jgi:hypothetical protein